MNEWMWMKGKKENHKNYNLQLHKGMYNVTWSEYWKHEWEKVENYWTVSLLHK